jgi:V/A-type H+-transporting ATPase subunit F
MSDQRTYQLAMIGDASTVRGFGAGGVRAFPADSSSTALALLRDLVARDEFAVIYITEALAEPILDQISNLHTGTVPAVIVVPDQSGARGIGYERVRAAVERAIGIDLLGMSRSQE